MKRWRLFVPACFFFLSADLLALELVVAEFGLFDASDPLRVIFSPADVVPRREGQRYGWMIELRDAPRSVSVREEYLLPGRTSGAFTESDEGAKLVIPMERRSQVSQRQLVPVDGVIYGEWSVGPREPAGPRRLEVIVEEEAVAVFDFEVR